VALAALALSGCFTGHLFAYGRRRAEVETIRRVEGAAAGVLVGWDGRVSADDGTTLGRGTWWSSLREDGHEVAAAAPSKMSSTALPQCASDAETGCVEVVVEDGSDRALRVREGDRSYDVPLARLTRTWTAPWTYALLPAALVADVIAAPFFVVMTPAAWILGD
jgi:hypothetical protein